MKKGDHLIYTGPYDASISEAAKYSPGVVVAFRSTNYGKRVTVELDDGSGYADWPVNETSLAEEP